MLKVANSVISASRITGVLPVVNGGTGVTTSTGTGNTVLSASPTLSGDVSLSTGNLVISTAGKGIDFSATSGTGTSELLADYEEGACAVTITALTGSFTTTTINSQTYTKIGRVVFMQVKFQVTTIGTAADGFQISVLPFLASPGNAFAIPGKNISNEATFNGFVELYGDSMRFAVALVNTHTYLITAIYFV
jgi:hypothetical protein